MKKVLAVLVSVLVVSTCFGGLAQRCEKEILQLVLLKKNVFAGLVFAYDPCKGDKDVDGPNDGKGTK